MNNTHQQATGLLLVTHGHIGHAMREVAEFILGQSLPELGCLCFRQSQLQATDHEEIVAALERCDRGQGVLVLTDLNGASPHNQVSRLASPGRVAVVSGLNLAMLLRALNYRQHPPEELARLAAKGGKRDIREKQP